jgi:hypothetical protein
MKKTPHTANYRAFAIALLVASLTFSPIGSAQSPSPPEKAPAALDVNDISFLFPVPTSRAEVDALISLNDEAADGKIFPDELLEKLMEEAKTVGVGSDRIKLPDEAQFKKPITWKVAGIRVNPSALGTNPAVLKQIGIVPGIRLIAQPITVNGDKFVLHDFAAHVVFNFTLPRPDNQRLPFLSDDKAFDAMIKDLRDIKSFLDQAGVTTANQELNIHPGFTKKVPGFTDKLRALLKTHLNRERLAVVSFMGIPGQFEPWIFFKVTVEKDGTLTRELVSGNFVPPPQPPSQMLSFVGGAKVDPAPVPDATALRQGLGISTSPLFSKDASSHIDDRLFPNAAEPSVSQLKLRDVADRIANPQFHNTATTDCVSCHTETTRRNNITGLVSQPGVAFTQPSGISKVAPALLPKDKWNLRNFGWGFAFFENKTFKPTITQRAANEAAESADFINKASAGPSPVAQPVASRDSAVDLSLLH